MAIDLKVAQRPETVDVVSLDPARPALLFRIGHYPLHHGTLGAVRSLGRAGVPVYAMTEGRWTPVARSSYLSGYLVSRLTGAEEPSEVLRTLVKLGREVGERAILIPTDDEAAVFAAEHAEQLEPFFVLPQVPPDLPRRLASKRGLVDVCRKFDIPTPLTVGASCLAEVKCAADRMRFPLIIKNAEPWTRLTNPTVSKNTVGADAAVLSSLAGHWREPFSIIMQEYIPADLSQDWIVHAYAGADAASSIIFTGVKVRSWPVEAVTKAATVHLDPGGTASP